MDEEAGVMTSADEIMIMLKRSPDDPAQFSREYQETIGNVLAALRVDGVETKPRIFTMDAVGSVGGYTGEFIAMANALGPATIAALSGWLAGRNGRKVRIKVEGIEVEANSMKQLDEALRRVEQVKRDNEPKRVHE